MGMPNHPKTPHSTFRIPSELKAQASAKAKIEGRDLTAVIVSLLTGYVQGGKK